MGARVNGRMVPLRTKLRNGDIVEVITQNGHTPSRDWLTFVKSPRARNKIRHWLNEHQRERAIEIGRKLLEREARKYKVGLAQFEESDYARVAADYSVATPNDLWAAIGFGKYSARQVLNRLAPGLIHQPQEAEAAATPSSPGADAVRRAAAVSGTDSLIVEGQNELLVYRARCCNPIRGEEIIGYVTRGKGVAVHARSCPNVQNLLYEADRRIAVEWARTTEDKAGPKQTYPVRFTVHCDDRAGMLKEITAVISDENTNIRTMETHLGDAGDAQIRVRHRRRRCEAPDASGAGAAELAWRARCAAVAEAVAAKPPPPAEPVLPPAEPRPLSSPYNPCARQHQCATGNFHQAHALAEDDPREDRRKRRDAEKQDRSHRRGQMSQRIGEAEISAHLANQTQRDEGPQGADAGNRQRHTGPACHDEQHDCTGGRREREQLAARRAARAAGW